MHPDYTLVPAEFAKLIRWLRQSCCKPVKPKPIKPQPKTLTEEASDLMQSYRVLVEEATKTIVDEGLRQDALDTLGVAFRTKMEDLYRKDRQ